MDKLFLELSKVLTGFEELKPEIAGVYYQQFQTIYHNQLDDLLKAFDLKVQQQPGDREALVLENIWSDTEFKAICQAIVLAWYNSAIVNGAGTWLAPAEIYYEALLWKAVEAHPPALSGGYFGYWRYAPEN